MAVDNSLTSLLSTLTASIESASEAIPKEENIAPPKDGISLLDTKNELLLSYLQNLVFLILLKLRTRSLEEPEDDEDEPNIKAEVTQKLVELRVYLEKGVRPLENRLKYQIDRMLRATEDAARKSEQKPGNQKTAVRQMRKPTTDDLSDSDASESGSTGTSDEDEDADEVSYGPNRAAFARPAAPGDRSTKESSKDGIYRPPRITPMAMPTTRGREEREARRPGKSATLDEFIATELSTAPMAEPSIGSTIVSGGRHTKSDRERREEAERREYEETNFTRLPKENKKDRAKKGNQARNGGWGGEEWRGLGAGIDRIERLTQKKGGSLGSLGRSRKRPVEDGPRGSGVQAGDAFEKRRKVVSKYRK